MGIPRTQTAPQYKRGIIRSDTNKGRYVKGLSTIPWILFVCCLTITSAAACPAACSCNAVTATCNNQKYKETPTGFSSTIETLYLYNNNITRISAATLRPLQHLKLLDLSGNKISDLILWDGIFRDLHQLENLMLQENRITKISKNLFKGLTKLARIYLQQNRISFIEPGSFDNLPKLVELKLSHNKLESFPVLVHTPNLRLLDLSFNRIGTIRDMAFSTVNLEHLLLRSNRLTELRTSLFDDSSRLTKLDISNNRLTAVPQVVKSFTSLKSLNMSLNKVGAIDKHTFKGMHDLKLLDIHGMGLTDFPLGTIPRRVILNLLDITGNDWSCGCGMHWLPEYMGIFRDAFIAPDNIRCSKTSKLAGRNIEKLAIEDFDCTEAELASTMDTTTTSTVTLNPPTTTTRKPRWFPDPCAVYECWNGGKCSVEGRRPKCRCPPDWTGPQCGVSLTSPTTTTTLGRSRATTTVEPQKSELFIKRDSVTESSVEIMLPVTERELDVTILEVGSRGKPTSQRITPKTQPFTVEGLESGKTYNICIHMSLERRAPNSDTLCGLVSTEEAKEGGHLTETSIRIIPSKEGKNDEPGVGDQYISNSETSDSLEDPNFKVIYPAVGAAVGAVIILSVLVLFFVCYRHRKLKSLKNHLSSDYVAGAPTDEMELPTVVHHHHHNHYSAGKDAKKQTTDAVAQKKSNPKCVNNNSSKITTPQRTSSLGRSSIASSSNSGTVHSRFTDTPQHYHQQYIPPPVTNHTQYEPVHDFRANGRSDFVYSPPGNHSPMQNIALLPLNPHYEADPLDDTQPMLADMGHYAPYANNTRTPYQDRYPVNHRREYAPASCYPQGNSRSAFQPIQSPRNNTVRTPTSGSGPITTHVNTAQVMPTSACLNGNMIADNMLRYPEGVPVV